MPETIRKVDGYRVTSPGKVHAKHTSLKKAKGQVRLLRGVKHGMIPRKRKLS